MPKSVKMTICLCNKLPNLAFLHSHHVEDAMNLSSVSEEIVWHVQYLLWSMRTLMGLYEKWLL